MKSVKLKGGIKLLMGAGLFFFMLKACRMEYANDVIESMSAPVYRQLLETFPEWSVERIVDYYMENRDSLDQEYLIEFEEYGDFNND
jgi:hypothetical protein